MNFRDRIKELCNNQGITQKELAEKLGISDISLNQTLRGKYPQLQTLERITIALNVPITDLFEQPATEVINCPNCGAKLTLKMKE